MCTPESWCVSSLLEIRMRREKRKRDGKGKLREDRGLISLKGHERDMVQPRLPDPRQSWILPGLPAVPPKGLLGLALMSSQLQRAEGFTGRVLVSQTYAQKTVCLPPHPTAPPPPPNSSHISKSCHREKVCQPAGLEDGRSQRPLGGMPLF